MQKISSVIIIAGFGFFALAFILVCALPWLVSDFKPVVTDIYGRQANVPDYTSLELAGKKIYQKEICWQCHSQYVRPLAAEVRFYGPVSQPGESALDKPHFYGTRRVGPDLAREGGKRTDDWQIAHFYNPRWIISESVMPRFSWLFKDDKILKNKIADYILKKDQDGNKRITFDEAGEDLSPYDLNKDSIVSSWDLAPQLTEEGKALLSYIQRLGTGIGDWRSRADILTPARPEGLMSEPLPLRIQKGEKVYNKKCVGCHGGQFVAIRLADTTKYEALQTGAVYGPLEFRKVQERPRETWRDSTRAEYTIFTVGQADIFLNPRPRDFTTGQYKFRGTPSGSLPTDADIFNTISCGVYNTSMPAWESIAEADRWYLVDYLKTFSERFATERPAESIEIPKEIAVTEEGLLEGRQIYRLLECWKCHGLSGKGDGPSANTQKDDWGDPTKPRDLTDRRNFKRGYSARSIFLTVNTGLDGSPMATYYDNFLLTREGVEDISAYADYLTADQMQELAAYIRNLPTDRQMAKMTDQEKTTLANQRRWNLVHYVMSLAPTPTQSSASIAQK